MPDQSYTETFNTAVRLAQAGQKQAAHAQLNKLNISHPDDPNLLLWLAFTSDDLVAARVLIYRVRNISPQNPSLPQALQWLATEEAKARSKPLSAATSTSPFAAVPPPSAMPAPKATVAEDSPKQKGSAPWWAQEEKEDDEKEIVEPSPWQILTRPLVLLGAGAVIVLILLFTVILPTFFSSDPSGGQGVAVSFNFHLIAADYSSSLDRLILVSDNPNQLHIYDPATQKDTTVDLPRTPLNVAVSADGKFAAVGHSGLISYVDLQKGQLTKLDLPTDPASLVIGNGVIYAIPATAPAAGDTKVKSLYVVQISSNKLLNADLTSAYASGAIRLSPDGKSLYFLTTNTTNAVPSLGHANLDSIGIPHFLYQSSYTTQYNPCGNLWINEDSSQVFTACGAIFRATHTQNTDMAYSGKLGDLTSVYNLTTSITRHEIFAISGNVPDNNQPARLPNSNQIQVFDYVNFTFQRSFILPSLKIGNSYYESRAQAIFINKTGTSYYAIVRTADGSGAPNDAGYVTNAFPTATAAGTPAK